MGKKESRHGKYKVGTCKFTVTIENEDRLRVHRSAVDRGFKDDSEFVRYLIHEAVWEVDLLDEDLEALKAMRKSQEVK